MIEGLVKDVRYKLPIYGGAADVKRGAFVMVGATPGTDNGALIKASGASATPDIVGRLNEMLDYSEDGETLVAGTSFVTKTVLLAHPFRIFRIPYDSSSVISATQAVSTTTITLTSLEDDIDAAFLYVQSGIGLGQTNYLTASASGSATLKAAFTTSLDTTSRIIKILPRFHDLISLNTDGTMLASQAAAGAIKGMVIDSYIEVNGRLEQLNPTKHAALTGLSTRRSIRFYADVAIRDTATYTVD
jgi:hypothetical protein